MKDLIYLEGAEGMEKLASYAVARNLIPNAELVRTVQITPRQKMKKVE